MNEQDQNSNSKPRNTSQKMVGSNEYDVQMEQIRVDALKESKSSNEYDENIAKWKIEETKVLAELNHTLDMQNAAYKDAQHLRETIATVGKWALVCGTYLTVQILSISSRTEIAKQEAQFGTTSTSGSRSRI
jgi:hypothetical protein